MRVTVLGVLERKRRKTGAAAGLISEGDACMDHHLPEEAISFYSRAVQLDPENSVAWNNLGLASFFIKEYARAETSFDRAVQLDSEYAEAWKNKGHLLAALRRYPEAHACYDRAIAIQPKNVGTIWTEKGRAYYSEGNYDDAIACFDRTILMDPMDIDSREGKGTALCRKGFFREAMECYEQVLQMDPLHARARAYQKIATDNFNRAGGKRQSRIKDFA